VAPLTGCPIRPSRTGGEENRASANPTEGTPMKRLFMATVRDHSTGESSQVRGTTDVEDDQQAKADIQDAVRDLPGRHTATRIDLY